MTDAYVVDTGVFLRWFVDQPGFEHARQVQRDFVEGELQLETIDFARIEVAEVLRKKAYLALFVQLAIDRELPLRTADQKLCHAVGTGGVTELLSGVALDGG